MLLPLSNIKMKDHRIKKKIEMALIEKADFSKLVLTINQIIGGLTKVKTKGNGRITFFNYNDGYTFKLDDKMIEGIALSAYAKGYNVEAHLRKGFSTKHYSNAFCKAAKNYK